MSVAQDAGKQAYAITEGFAYSDDGSLHRRVQDAVDAASSYVRVGPAEFLERVDLDVPGLTLEGCGRATLIHGGDDHAIVQSADRTTVRNLSVETDVAGDMVFGLVSSGNPTHIRAHRVTVRNSDLSGISYAGPGPGWVTNCVIEQAGTEGIGASQQTCVYGCDVNNPGTTGIHARQRSVVAWNIVRGSGATGDAGIDLSGNIYAKAVFNIVKDSASIGIQGNGADQIIAGNTVENSADDGIEIVSDDSVAAYNRVMGSGNEGIDVGGTDTLVVCNRVSGSTNDAINTGGATTPTLANNVTGSAN